MSFGRKRKQLSKFHTGPILWKLSKEFDVAETEDICERLQSDINAQWILFHLREINSQLRREAKRTRKALKAQEVHM